MAEADENAPPDKEVEFRPSVFYRREHPDYFSDTTEVAEPLVTSDLLAFHLDQLTAAKKEREFEDFCRRLAEREICPNLLPQTGPVGGGDSKTDASTYPVAPELGNFRWWVGHTAPTSEDSCRTSALSPVRLNHAVPAFPPFALLPYRSI